MRSPFISTTRRGKICLNENAPEISAYTQRAQPFSLHTTRPTASTVTASVSHTLVLSCPLVLYTSSTGNATTTGDLHESMSDWLRHPSQPARADLRCRWLEVGVRCRLTRGRHYDASGLWRAYYDPDLSSTDLSTHKADEREQPSEGVVVVDGVKD